MSRTITGTIISIVGLALIAISPIINFFSLAYSIPILIIGLFILFNKNEDKIEKIKRR